MLTTFADGIFLTTSNVYDSAGRQIATSDAAGLVTTYAYPNPLTSVTISSGGLLTNTTVRYPDGRTKCTLQNGVIQSWYNYGVSPNGTRWAITYTGPAGLASPVWQRTTTDLLGRTIRTERPGFGGSVLVTSNFFDTANHLVRTTSSSAGGVYAVTLYAYDPLGNATLTAQDLNLNGILDLAGPDRVTSNATEFVQIGGDWYRESRSYTFPEDNSATAILTGTQRQRLTGLGAAMTVTVDGTAYTGILMAQSISEDLLGNTSTNYTVVDRDTRTGVQVSTSPDSVKNQYHISVNGLAQYSISKTDRIQGQT